MDLGRNDLFNGQLVSLGENPVAKALLEESLGSFLESLRSRDKDKDKDKEKENEGEGDEESLIVKP